jgi:protein regulator of cytokinesis 1
VRLVTAEKRDMIDEAKKIITTIRQMETSLDDSKHRRSNDDADIHITYPLNRCLQTLKEKKAQIARLHRERFEQVKSKRPEPILAVGGAATNMS